MQIKSLILKNFRGYSGETTINFDNLTAFVGCNDIGKSSILEALDIFFNDSKGIIKLEKNDVNMDSRSHGDTEISIAVRFTDLPDRIVIDSTCETTLAQEYLLNPDGLLEIVKRYSNGGSAKPLSMPCILQILNVLDFYIKRMRNYAGFLMQTASLVLTGLKTP